jgi:hypothetical protein
VTGGGRLAGIDVADNDDVDVELLVSAVVAMMVSSEFDAIVMDGCREGG